MDIEKCFKILELERDASPNDIKQSYKDIVNVWHPDRFSGNPRLRKKAEEKLKEVNVAYEQITSYISSKQKVEPEKEQDTRGKFWPEKDFDPGGGSEPETEHGRSRENSESFDKMEDFVRAGTGVLLNVWSYLSSMFQQAVENAKTEMGQGTENRGQGNTCREKGRGMRMGGNMGRGGGRRMGRGGRGGRRG